MKGWDIVKDSWGRHAFLSAAPDFFLETGNFRTDEIFPRFDGIEVPSLGDMRRRGGLTDGGAARLMQPMFLDAFSFTHALSAHIFPRCPLPPARRLFQKNLREPLEAFMVHLELERGLSAHTPGRL